MMFLLNYRFSRLIVLLVLSGVYFNSHAGTINIVVEQSINPLFSVSEGFNTIAFGSAANLTGNNPQNHNQFFAFDRSTGILTQLTNADGSQPLSVDYMSILHNGSAIVFSTRYDFLETNADLSPELFFVDINGENLRQLTNHINGGTENVSGISFEISPDDTTIYYSKSMLTSGNTILGYDIFKMSLASPIEELLLFRQDSGPFEVSVNQSALVKWELGSVLLYDLTESQGFPNNINPFFNVNSTRGYQVTNDGSQVVFASAASVVGNIQNTRQYSEIYIINTDGSGLEAITQAQDTDTLSREGSIKPTLSANDDKVLFEADTSVIEPIIGNRPELYVYDISDNQITRITNFDGSARIGKAIISADGSTVAFYAIEDPNNIFDGIHELYLVGSDGSNLRKVDTIEFTDYNFGFFPNLYLSPNGDKVMYGSFYNPSGIAGEGSYAIFLYCTDESITDDTCDANGGTSNSGENQTSTNNNGGGGALNSLFLLLISCLSLRRIIKKRPAL